MNFSNLLRLLSIGHVLLLLSAVVVTSTPDAQIENFDHGLTRGGDAHHRSLQRGISWLQTETVCRKSGVGESRTYKTRKIVLALWRVYEVLGMEHGVMGSCESVCPCGENGSCTTLPGDKLNGSNATATSYSCDCNEGFFFDGTSCATTGTTSIEACGGFAGTLCTDESMTCIDDPLDDCNPNKGGADCIGICVPSCAGYTAGPQPGCPDGTFCVDNPDTPDCIIAADCPGVCLPPPECNLADGSGCWEGFTCTNDPDVDCDSNMDCKGQCAQTCAGFTAFPQPACPSGTFCVDNPATPDCLIAADCTGVCLPAPKCNIETNDGCWEGFSCTVDLNTACIAVEGFPCPGVCAPTCAGFTEGPQAACPDGTSCVDNPATPDCLIAADCPGVCLPPPTCTITSQEDGSTISEGCNDGYSCTYDPTIACILMIGAPCQGICAQTCGGDRIDGNVPCPIGTYCFDNPATPDCLIAADCTGVCMPPSQCDLINGEGCIDGFSCTIDSECAAGDSSDCPGVCAPTCAGGRANNIECPDGTECVDNPATPNCLIAADCTGVCLVPPLNETVLA